MSKPNLLLLHGALGAADQFDALAPQLEEAFTLHRINFEGHGPTPIQHETFHNDYFVANVRDYLDAEGIDQIDIFGYSLGAYVACALALTDPDRVGRVLSMSTKFLWDEDIVKREIKMLDVATIKAKVPKFAEMLATRHTAEGWESVVNRTRDLLQSNTETGGLRPDVLGTLPHRIRIMVGDRDHTVAVEESALIYRSLQNGEFEVLPGTPHPFEKASLARLELAIREFFG